MDDRRESKFNDNSNQNCCPFKAAGVKDINYKDVDTLRKFTTDKGKILPRRITSVSSYFQRKLTKAIKKARQVALMPFVSND